MLRYEVRTRAGRWALIVCGQCALQRAEERTVSDALADAGEAETLETMEQTRHQELREKCFSIHQLPMSLDGTP